MNTVIARITVAGMLGRKRALLLLLLPAVLLLLALALRLSGYADPGTSAALLRGYGVAALLPLVTLIVGAGVLGTEIDDETIGFLLAKPTPRRVIVATKLGVAVGLSAAFAAVPILVAGLILPGGGGLGAALAVGATFGSVAYCAIFCLISLVSRHAVVIGLAYALVWEGLVGGFVPGARVLSVQQWVVSVSDALTSSAALRADVAVTAALPLLAAMTIAATWLAVLRLRSFQITGET